MADDTNEDSWLYGTSNPDSTTNEEERPQEDATEVNNSEASTDVQPNGHNEEDKTGDTQQSPDSNQKEGDKMQDDGEGMAEEDPASQMEEQEHYQAHQDMNEIEEDMNDKDQGDEDSDESDDDINVVIGDIKSGPPTYNIKQRPNLLASSSTVSKEKPQQQVGKFNIEEFESVGTINGVPAHEFSIDSLEDKPWRKPGADITDYFNYGFNEDTWRSYCERQKRIRVNESGVGLTGLTGGPPIPVQTGGNNRTLTPLINNENSKYSNAMNLPRRPIPPPAPAKENVIQVMTAECREYSRPGGMPPNTFEEQFFDQDAYSYGYEPTQDSQWMNEHPNWTPSGIKELTPGPQMVPPPMGMHPLPMPPNMRPPLGVPMNLAPPPPHMQGMMPPPRMVPPIERGGPISVVGGGNIGIGNVVDKERDRERDRDRDRERERRDRERDRERERERDRERDRDRDRDRERDRTVERDWDRTKDKERERDHERSRSERGKSEESDRQGMDSPSRDRDRRRDRHRDKERERSVRRERSRSREKSRRRSRSRDRERERDKKTRDKKKSHRKDKDDSE